VDVFFAKTRYHYDSYKDFWKLVELSGFQTCYVDEIDIDRDALYITSPVNGELRPHVTHRREISKGPQACTIVWWNLERPGTKIACDTDEILQYVDRIWVSDSHYASMDPRLEHVVMGSHPDLRLSPEPIERHWDWTHMSYTSFRRDPIYGQLRQRGLKEGHNGWDEERDRVLRASHLMLNVHQDDHQIGEPLRFVVCAAYSLPVVSETIRDPSPLKPGIHYDEVPYDRLVDRVAECREADISALGQALHRALCVDRTFRSSVEEALAR
jgi:hypothetical protein